MEVADFIVPAGVIVGLRAARDSAALYTALTAAPPQATAVRSAKPQLMWPVRERTGHQGGTMTTGTPAFAGIACAGLWEPESP